MHRPREPTSIPKYDWHSFKSFIKFKAVKIIVLDGYFSELIYNSTVNLSVASNWSLMNILAYLLN